MRRGHAATQRVFDQGHLVGELAHQLYPNGINLHTENIGSNLKETRASLSLRKTLFEAVFSSALHKQTRNCQNALNNYPVIALNAF